MDAQRGNWIAELNKLTFVELVTRFPDEPSAIVFLEAMRWPDGPYCHRCGCTNVSRVESDRKRPILYCTGCKEQFSVTTGTVMEDTKIGLHKWLMAIHLMCASKKGISSLQLHRMLGIARRSAWHLAHRIRHAMEGARPTVLRGTVEMDETYVGGVRRGKKRGYRGNKTAVVAVVERNGSALSHVMPDDKVVGEDVALILTKHVDKRAVLNTDEATIYTDPGKAFRAHDKVNHRAYEYVRHGARVATTNTVEGYFGNFDRQINGTHHHVSPRHLHRYVIEFDYKYNTRRVTDGNRTAEALRLIEGRRLTLFRTATGAPSLQDDR